MGDVHRATAVQIPSARGHATSVDPPQLRRTSGTENMSSLRVINVSPGTERKQYVLLEDPALGSPKSDLSGSVALHSPVLAGQRHEEELMSPAASRGPSSIFDIPEERQDELYTENTEVLGPPDGGLGYPAADVEEEEEEEEELDSYNLKPPPPRQSQRVHDDLEALSDRLFSSDHLDLILKDYTLAARFTRFLQSYRPAYADTLKQYVEARKAIIAVEYANAVTKQMQPQMGYPAFVVDKRFEIHSEEIQSMLLEEALPAYLTHRLVQLVTDTLVKEITQNSAPIMHELIPSLAEVYCISDPSMKDNPIVYASEEFYNITQYSKGFTIGRNCRFLQGEKTSASTVARLIQALSRGEECCETILNYRRDGSPFWNLLMIAPLYDNKGDVRYFLGCQIDVSSLIEGGRGLESFAQLLYQDRAEVRAGGGKENKGDPSVALGDLGQLLTEEEAEIVKNRTQKANAPPPELGRSGSMVSSPRGLLSRSGTRSNRIVLGVDSEPTPEPQLWPSASLGPSGRLPGVYQNYLLVRPYPSLRITFTSPSLRIPGLLQTKLLDRIGGPSSIREGLHAALARGTGVTAKVAWLTSSSHADIEGGRTRWLHCTPLLGSDDRVGVWMIVLCEDESAMMTGSLTRAGSSAGFSNNWGAQKFTSSKLYSDYLKREGRESRPMSALTDGTNGSSQTRADMHVMKAGDEKKHMDDLFRDF